MINIRNKKIGKNELIPLSFDYIFTGIFNNKENMELIESFVGVFLEINPKELKGKIEIISRDLEIENKKEKNNKVDLLLNYKGEKINIELNNEGYSSGIVDRNIVYACLIHGRGLLYGDRTYGNIRTTIQLNFNTKIKNKHEVIESYYLRNKYEEKLSEKLKIEMIDVEKGAIKCYNEPRNAKYQWCRLLKTKSVEEQEDILRKIGEEVMGKEVKERLKKETKKYSEDEQTYELYTELSHEEIVKNTIRANSLEEGISIGKDEGKKEAKLEDAKNLLKLGVDVNIISKATGFSKEEILSLKE